MCAAHAPHLSNLATVQTESGATSKGNNVKEQGNDDYRRHHHHHRRRRGRGRGRRLTKESSTCSVSLSSALPWRQIVTLESALDSKLKQTYACKLRGPSVLVTPTHTTGLVLAT